MNNEDRPDEAFTTERAQRAGRANASSGAQRGGRALGLRVGSRRSGCGVLPACMLLAKPPPSCSLVP